MQVNKSSINKNYDSKINGAKGAKKELSILSRFFLPIIIQSIEVQTKYINFRDIH